MGKNSGNCSILAFILTVQKWRLNFDIALKDVEVETK
jgi:hypothetical protein